MTENQDKSDNSVDLYDTKKLIEHLDSYRARLGYGRRRPKQEKSSARIEKRLRKGFPHLFPDDCKVTFARTRAGRRLLSDGSWSWSPNDPEDPLLEIVDP